jgi:hypothetical protein
MAVGLASRLPNSMYSGLTKLGVDPTSAHTIAHTPPVGTLFAAFLGDNPIESLMKQVDPSQLKAGSGVDVTTLTGHRFFPDLISSAFKHGLLIAFGASIVMLLIAMVASMMRGERFVHDDQPVHESIAEAVAREGAALSTPAIPGEDVAYDDALSSHPVRT